MQVTGLTLKKEGTIIESDGKLAVVKWCEKTSRQRDYHYLVRLKGEKYTKPYRLRAHEQDYWIDHIKNNKLWSKNGRNKEDKKPSD